MIDDKCDVLYDYSNGKTSPPSESNRTKDVEEICKLGLLLLSKLNDLHLIHTRLDGNLDLFLFKNIKTGEEFKFGFRGLDHKSSNQTNEKIVLDMFTFICEKFFKENGK